jgi:hypothetical protein
MTDVELFQLYGKLLQQQIPPPFVDYSQLLFYCVIFFTYIVGSKHVRLKPTLTSLVLCLMIVYSKIFPKYFKDIPFVSLIKSFLKSFWLTKILHYIIIVKFDLNNVPNICCFKSINDSSMSFSSAKNPRYTVKKMYLVIQYSLYLFQTFSSVSIMY